MTERGDVLELWERLRQLQKRQGDLREIRAWLEGRSAILHERGEEALAHDEAFLRDTQPMVAWIERELAAIEQDLGRA